jgi:hypothetical protein
MAAKRDTIKQDYKDVNTIAVYSQIQELVSEANFVTFIPADEEHKTSVKGQNIYNAKIDIDNIEYLVRIKVDVPLWIIGSYNYAGHKIIKM